MDDEGWVRYRCDGSGPVPARYDLRWTIPFNGGRGYVLPCDVEGHVAIGDLTDLGSGNCLGIRVVMGKALSIPVIALVD